MKKNILIILLCLMLTFILGDAVAFDASIAEGLDSKSPEEWLKEGLVIENGVLKKYNGEAGIVIIPNSVKEIGEYAFFDNDVIREIIIPETVTKIASWAYNSMDNLVSLTLPASI